MILAHGRDACPVYLAVPSGSMLYSLSGVLLQVLGSQSGIYRTFT